MRKSGSRWFDVVAMHHPSGTLVTCAGELDLATVDRIADVVTSSFEVDPAVIVLDLRRVLFIDSSGVAGLVEIADRCAAHGIRFSLKPSPQVEKVVRLLGVGPSLPVRSIRKGA